MKIFFYLLIFTFCFFVLKNTNAQTKTIDSLEKVLVSISKSNDKKSKIDVLKIKLNLIDFYTYSNPKKAITFLNDIELSIDTLKNEKVKATFYIAKGYTEKRNKNYSKAFSYLDKAEIIASRHKDSLVLKTKIHYWKGVISDNKSDVKNSFHYFLKALYYAEKSEDKDTKLSVLSALGNLYLLINNKEKAKKIFLQCIKIKKKENEVDSHLASYYTNLSSVYDEEGKHEKSIYYLNLAIEINESLNRKMNLIINYNNKANALNLLKKYNQAEKFIKKSIFIADSLNMENENMYSYNTYAETLIGKGKIKEAIKIANKSIDLCKKNKDFYLLAYNYNMLYKSMLESKKYKESIHFLNLKNIADDSLFNIDKQNQIDKLIIEYDIKKKNNEITKLNNENEIKSLKLKKSKSIQYSIILSTLLGLIILILLLNRYKNNLKTEQVINDVIQSDFEKKVLSLELEALRSQMNPHFLFNCLNSINSFIISNKQEQATEYLTKFSKLIRQVLNNSKQKRVTLSNELETLELYIQMEMLRFGEKFSYSVDIDDDVEIDYIEVPPLIIQPYVENSIWHGLLNKNKGEKNLNIKISQTNNYIICAIIDNGIGREAAIKNKSKSIQKNKSYGMSITKERLNFINKKNINKSIIEVIDLKDSSGKANGTQINIKIYIEN